MAPRKKGAADPAKPAKAHNLIDPAIRKQFLEMKEQWNTLNERAKSAAGKRRQYEAEIKKAGFSLSQIKISILVDTPEGEAEFKARLSRELMAAAYAGAEVGDQLALFVEPDRTPAIERAAQEGQQAAMEGKTHAPPYDASVPQYKAWSDAYYAEQERAVLAGIKKKEGKDAAAKGKNGKGGKGGKGKKGPNADPPAGSQRSLIKKADKDAAAAAKAPEPPRTAPSAAPVTRSTLGQQREAARENAESYFTKSTDTAGSA